MIQILYGHYELRCSVFPQTISAVPPSIVTNYKFILPGAESIYSDSYEEAAETDGRRRAVTEVNAFPRSGSVWVGLNTFIWSADSSSSVTEWESFSVAAVGRDGVCSAFYPATKRLLVCNAV